jgi:hypothetical protein
MAELAEHITALETELAVMTRDGHHADPGISNAMKQLDTICYLLNKRKRELAQTERKPQ